MWEVRRTERRANTIQLMLEERVEFPTQTGGMGKGGHNSESFIMADIECSWRTELGDEAEDLGRRG